MGLWICISRLFLPLLNSAEFEHSVATLCANSGRKEAQIDYPAPYRNCRGLQAPVLHGVAPVGAALAAADGLDLHGVQGAGREAGERDVAAVVVQAAVPVHNRTRLMRRLRRSGRGRGSTHGSAVPRGTSHSGMRLFPALKRWAIVAIRFCQHFCHRSRRTLKMPVFLAKMPFSMGVCAKVATPQP